MLPSFGSAGLPEQAQGGFQFGALQPGCRDAMCSTILNTSKRKADPSQALHVCHIYLHWFHWGGARGINVGVYSIHGVYGQADDFHSLSKGLENKEPWACRKVNLLGGPSSPSTPRLKKEAILSQILGQRDKHGSMVK